MTTTSNPCLFCRIARRECPAHIVYEDDYLVAFLDTGPIRPGHVQIIPRDHYPTFDDLTAELASRIIVLGQRLARILKASHRVSRAAFLFTGGDIAHAHAHVLPMIAPTDITSRRYIAEENVTFQPIARPSEAELGQVAFALREALKGKDTSP
ncbi:HIT domain-containing protein [Nordella sp. HKS 07]|uniref:HIT family protein n=1 Tax=Nordella sp. HKS 07 TaxID=2712222 RepID=UPI0013E13B59|nr:HIT domain-containing protein [Nordella sp. HKS 07]QIG50677.1 HIT domain-containing protein [Nordella sp. HKS 07]